MDALPPGVDDAISGSHGGERRTRPKRDKHATTLPVRTPGRPRSAEAHRAILDAAVELLAEEGFEGLSIERVAARAGVGKTTVYRRWTTKEALIVAAVQGLHADYPLIDTGNLRDDLQALARTGEQPRAQELLPRLLPRFISQVAANPTVFDAFWQAMIMPRLQRLIEMIERAKARGELRADVEPAAVVELFGGAFYFQMLFGRLLGLPPSDFARRLIDTLWQGIASPDPAP